MTTLLSLVGEQPIPILLPARYLQPSHHLLLCTERTRPVAERVARLTGNGQIELCEAYALEKLLPLIHKLCATTPDVTINLTGGTKFMAMAAFAVALQNNLRFVYLESERQKSVLYQYTVGQSNLKAAKPLELPELITVTDYLNAHLSGFHTNGFSKDEASNLTIGGQLEQAIHRSLAPHFDLLCGIQPDGVDKQIEIDLVIRCGNQVGVAEVKLGDREGENPKKGIDQLSTASSREYLGTYTSKFLITANRMPPKIRTLAQEKNIHLIELPSYRNGLLSVADQQHLIQKIKAKLTGESK